MREVDFIDSFESIAPPIVGSAIDDDSITGVKILLENEESLRSKDFAGTGEVELIKVNDSDIVVFPSQTQISITPTVPNDLVNKAYSDTKQASSEKGQNNGYAPLDGSGLIPLINLPTGLGIVKDLYSDLLTWVLTAADGVFAFATDNKTMYYSANNELQEVALMKTINGTITTAQVLIGTTPARATVSGSAPAVTRKRLVITPIETNGNIYIGGSSVSALNGKQIIGPDTLSFDWDASDYFLISDQPGNIVSVLEVY